MSFVKAFEEHIKDTIGVEINRYIDRVNTFPAAGITESKRERRHYGGETHIIETSQLRGYTRTSIETAIDDAESLARELERATQAFVRVNALNVLVGAGILSTQSGLEITTQSLISLSLQQGFKTITNSRVLTLTTDEGLLAPYGVCDLEVQWTYVSYS